MTRYRITYKAGKAETHVRVRTTHVSQVKAMAKALGSEAVIRKQDVETGKFIRV